MHFRASAAAFVHVFLQVAGAKCPSPLDRRDERLAERRAHCASAQMHHELFHLLRRHRPHTAVLLDSALEKWLGSCKRDVEKDPTPKNVKRGEMEKMMRGAGMIERW